MIREKRKKRRISCASAIKKRENTRGVARVNTVDLLYRAFNDDLKVEVKEPKKVKRVKKVRRINLEKLKPFEQVITTKSNFFQSGRHEPADSDLI